MAEFEYGGHSRMGAHPPMWRWALGLRHWENQRTLYT